MNLDELTKLMFRLAIPSDRLPGLTFPEALSRTYGVLLGQYLGVSDDRLIEDLLAPDHVAESDHMTIGRAFAAAMLRSSGNAYAAALVIETLKEYSGKEVPADVGKLLKVLEHYVIRSGDVQQPEGESSH
jgi:hypothetical protein